MSISGPNQDDIKIWNQFIQIVMNLNNDVSATIAL